MTRKRAICVNVDLPLRSALAGLLRSRSTFRFLDWVRLALSRHGPGLRLRPHPVPAESDPIPFSASSPAWSMTWTSPH